MSRCAATLWVSEGVAGVPNLYFGCTILLGNLTREGVAGRRLQVSPPEPEVCPRSPPAACLLGQSKSNLYKSLILCTACTAIKRVCLAATNSSSTDVE